MRDLEQAKAEVFRRSNARIKKRKTIRRSILACCVPVVLCIGIWSFTILPAMMPAKASDSAEADFHIMSGANGLAPESALVYDSEKSQSATAGVSGVQNGAFVFEGKPHRISGEDAGVILDILEDLDYSPSRVCRCLPQFKFESSAGSYGLHLSEGYARCSKGQAALTEDQIRQIRKILHKYNLKLS